MTTSGKPAPHIAGQSINTQSSTTGVAAQERARRTLTGEKLRLNPISYRQLAETPDGPVFVVNTSSMLGGATSEVIINVTTQHGQERPPLTVQATWLPVELTVGIRKATLLESPSFQRALQLRMLTVIGLADVRALLSDPRAAAEQARLSDQREAVLNAIREQRADKTEATIGFNQDGVVRQTSDLLANTVGQAAANRRDAAGMFEIAEVDDPLFDAGNTSTIEIATSALTLGALSNYDDASLEEATVMPVAESAPTVSPLFVSWAKAITVMDAVAATAAVRELGRFEQHEYAHLYEAVKDIETHSNIARWAGRRAGILS